MITNRGTQPGPCLDQNLVPMLMQGPHPSRHQRDARFVIFNLFGDTDDHTQFSSMNGFQYQIGRGPKSVDQPPPN
jgi:hypothetical protein